MKLKGVQYFEYLKHLKIFKMWGFWEGMLSGILQKGTLYVSHDPGKTTDWSVRGINGNGSKGRNQRRQKKICSVSMKLGEGGRCNRLK